MATAALPPALDPEHLTDVLRRAGVLAGGRVSRVEIDNARDTLVSRIVRARLHYAGSADGAPDRLDGRRLYERFLASTPGLLARYRTHRDLTIVNGDAHVWNLFYPREPPRSDVKLMDWGGWRIDTATDDLAYMMALHWYPARRRRFEQPLLDRYHAALVAHGVNGYDRAALAEDYRTSVLWQLTTPLWQADHNIPAVIWWSHLDRILAAVDDLGCRDLLD